MTHPVGEEGLKWANYRPAVNQAEKCATCEFFKSGSICMMFTALVYGDYTCDEWTDEDEEDDEGTEVVNGG